MRRNTRSRKKRKIYKNEEEADIVIEEDPRVNLGSKNFFKIDSCSMSSLSQQRESVCSTERDIVQNMQQMPFGDNNNSLDLQLTFCGP